jgi:WD40 repeat protein
MFIWWVPEFMLALNIRPKWKSQEPDAEVYSLRLSRDGSLLAAGLSTGEVTLRSVATGRVSYSLMHSPGSFPVPAIRFLPHVARSFLTVSTDGVIREWGGQPPEITWTHREEANELYALDCHASGSHFATGGVDTNVRVYDWAKKAVVSVFTRRKFDQTTDKGHSDRVYAVKFHPSDPSLLFSGGWDNTVQMWDIRSQTSVGCFPGPHICGDALDVRGHFVLAGSWRLHDQIQLFDMRTITTIRKMRWSLAGDDRQCQIYVAKFLPNGMHFIVGGSGVNQVKAFSIETFASVGATLNFGSAVFAACVTDNTDSLIVGTANGDVVLHELQEHGKSTVFLTSV